MHLEAFPEFPTAWRNDWLAANWEKIKRVRRVVTGALEIERATKRIGSSLEAAPDVYVTDAELLSALEASTSRRSASRPASRCSTARRRRGPSPCRRWPASPWFRDRRRARKCARSWRFTDDVGSDPDYPELSARDAAAVRELDARAKVAQ